MVLETPPSDRRQQMGRRTTKESYHRTAAALRDRFDELVDATVEASLARVPEYARAGGDDFRRAYRAATQQALTGFLDILDGRDTGTGWRQAYQAIGAGEFRHGRSLEALQAGIR